MARKLAVATLHEDKQRQEYIRYALAHMIYFQRKRLEHPNDPFYVRQLDLHLDYSTRLLGKDDNGIRDGE
jgi:hypothetical protein